MITICAQYGGPKAGDNIRPLAIRLNEYFDQHPPSNYFSGVKKLSIILRVSGSVTDFGHEGPERLRYLKKSDEITIDFTIPESAWTGKSLDDMRKYLRIGFEQCFEHLMTKAIQSGAKIEIEIMNEIFFRAMNDLSEKKSSD